MVISKFLQTGTDFTVEAPAVDDSQRTDQDFPSWITRWYERAYYSLLIRHTPPEEAIPARDELRAIKVLDFFVMPARLVAKVQENRGRTIRVDVNFRAFLEDEWDAVTTALSNSPFLFAHLIAERFTEEFAAELGALEIELIPTDPTALLLAGDENGQPLPLRFVLAVFSKLFEHLHDNPFSIFTLRGRGKEETLETCRYRRASRPAKSKDDSSGQPVSTFTVSSPLLQFAPGRYWKYAPELQTLAETVRADELPAALLKRLDPIPVAELSERAEFVLEETYSTLARRAQVIAFQMRSAV